MARPKYTDNEMKAKERLEAAFWKLLSEKTYSKITVAEICKESGLNKNTFYYHYTTLDEMANALVHSSLDKQFAAYLLTSAVDTEFQTPLPLLNVNERFRHICLIAGKNSHPMLIATLKNSISDIWRDMLDIDDEHFTKELRIVFEFAIGGILSVMALNTKENNFSFTTLFELSQLDFVKSLLRAIRQM